ncbi:MAG: family peptidase [Thermosediminibacterales bacterium]|nr:family peptidase [Thermosediminibacterales bacterium]
MKIPELLAPAGNIEKLKIAVLYGADAVYFGGQAYGLRAFADNFSFEDMAEGVSFAHKHGAKVYVTVNIFPHNEDLEGLPQYIKKLYELGVDAVIISDPGVLKIVREVAPNLDVHLSTQANTTNWLSVNFWHEQGVKRIILARELTFDEIKTINRKKPEGIELEIFVHGAMCISYSGRCLLSNYMAYRDANRGECAHPCRWKYYLMEEKRPGEFYPVFEDERGSYIFNSKDLCMIHNIPEVVDTGVASLKIEGRMKSVHYVASVVKAYRSALNEFARDPDGFKYRPEWLEEISKASHREFTTGFYFGKPGENDQIYERSSYIREYDFVGIVKGYDSKEKIAIVEQRNRFGVGEEIEFFSPDRPNFIQRIDKMWDGEGNQISSAPHPQQIVKIPVSKPVKPYDILRRAKSSDQ